MTDRAQFTTPRSVRLLVSGLIALLVLALVINEMLSDPALAAGGIEQVCGLCHVDWKQQLHVLVSITGLVIAANWLLGGPKWPPEDDDE